MSFDVPNSAEITREHGRITALSADIGRALTSVASLREMLHGCTAAMVYHLDAAFARIWTLNEPESMLELQASAGMYTHLDGPHSRVPMGRFKIGLIAEERRAHLTNTVVGDPRVGDQEWAKREGMVAFAGYPLLVGDRLVGVAAMFARRPLSEDVLSALQAVADEIAIGIARKQSEDSLRASQDWLSTTLSSIGDAVISTDTAGLVTFMNRVAENITGWRQIEAVGQPLTAVFRIENERTREPIENPVDRVLREGVIVGLANHTILITKHGDEVAIDDSAAPIQDANGRMQGVVLVFRDVSKHRIAQRQAEAQHRVSALLAGAESIEQVAVGILQAVGETLGWTVGLLWIADPGARILRVSQTWSAGMESEAGADFASQSRQRTLRVGEGMPGQVLSTGIPQWHAHLADVVNFPRREDAAKAGIQSGLAFPLRSDGEMLGVIEFYHTRTQPPDKDLLRTLCALGQQVGQFMERRGAEDAVRASEAMKSAILSAALDCIVSMDNLGRVIEWNRVAELTFGYSREEAVGRELAELIIPPAYHERHRSGLARYLATGEGPVIGQRLEISAVRRDGAEFPVELTINRISVGAEPYFTGFIRDISVRIENEKRLQQTAENLTVEQARQVVMMRYLRATNRTAAKVATLVDPLEIARTVVATLAAEFDAPVAGLWLSGAGPQRLTLAAQSGLGQSPPSSVGLEIDVMMNAYKIGWVARYGRPYVGPIRSDDLQYEHDWVQREGLKWAAVFPLKARERLHGVLAVFLREEMPLGGSDVMATLATIITGSLDTAHFAQAGG